MPVKITQSRMMKCLGLAGEKGRLIACIIPISWSGVVKYDIQVGAMKYRLLEEDFHIL